MSANFGETPPYKGQYVSGVRETEYRFWIADLERWLFVNFGWIEECEW